MHRVTIDLPSALRLVSQVLTYPRGTSPFVISTVSRGRGGGGGGRSGDVVCPPATKVVSTKLSSLMT
jgi:hypothetical protein